MKLIRIPFAEAAQFDSKLQTIFNSFPSSKYLVLFFGSEVQGGNSWCPDCIVADPVIKKAISKVDNLVLIECPVGNKSEYKNVPNHPYKTHKQIQLQRVPTLIAWTKEGPAARLIEDECKIQENIENLIKNSSI